jgi:thioredoxin-like negative regulator of GroEL
MLLPAFSPTAMKLTELTDTSLKAYLGESGKPTVLVFHSTWSKPARTMVPVIKDIAESYGELVRFALVNAEAAPDALNRFGILSLPSYLLFKNGRLTDRFIGLLTKETLTERVEKSLAKM